MNIQWDESLSHRTAKCNRSDRPRKPTTEYCCEKSQPDFDRSRTFNVSWEAASTWSLGWGFECFCWCFHLVTIRWKSKVSICQKIMFYLRPNRSLSRCFWKQMLVQTWKPGRPKAFWSSVCRANQIFLWYSRIETTIYWVKTRAPDSLTPDRSNEMVMKAWLMASMSMRDISRYKDQRPG